MTRLLLRLLGIPLCAVCGTRQGLSHDGSDLELFERAKRARVLLLDDIGATFADRAGYWREQVASVLRHREAAVKPTIATANIESVAGLRDVDASLVSRCDASELAFKLEGPDYRKPHVMRPEGM